MGATQHSTDRQEESMAKIVHMILFFITYNYKRNSQKTKVEPWANLAQKVK